MDNGDLLAKIELNVVQGRRDREDDGLDENLAGTPGVSELVKTALDEGVGAKEIVLGALSKGMDEVGERYEAGEYFLPDMLTAAEAVGMAMEILEPLLANDGIKPKGKVIMATVKGDLHDIGKNIVGLMLKGAGYEIMDLGSDVDTQEIVEAVKEFDTDILGLSALLTTTMAEMAEIIEELGKDVARRNLKIIVGGAPLSAQFAEEIGADAYGKDAISAVRIADDLMNEKGQR